MTELEKAARQALEALEETRNALAWFYDSYPEDVTPKGNELLPHVEVVLADLRCALEQPAQQEPYGQVTVVRRPGCAEQHWFYRWPDPPYLDNAAECHTVYTRPQAREPLTDEQIEDEWERLTGHSIFGGDRAKGRAMYLSPDEVTEFARAIEAAHGIGEKK